MFGNLDVWAKHRRSSLISMSGPFLHCPPHSTAILNGCRGLFQLYINCAMDVLRLLIQSLLVQVQRCTNKVKQPSVLVQIWKWFSHFYMIWNMKNKLYWPKPAPFTVYPEHSTKPGKLRSATPAPLTSRSHVRFSKLLLRSFLIQAGTRQMHSNIHEQHLPSSSRWILSTKKCRADPLWVVLCGGSLGTQSKLVTYAGSTVTMQNQSGISVTQEISGCPVAFIHLCDSIFVILASHHSKQWSVWTSVTLWRTCKNLSTGYACQEIKIYMLWHKAIITIWNSPLPKIKARSLTACLER